MLWYQIAFLEFQADWDRLESARLEQELLNHGLNKHIQQQKFLC